MKLNRTVHITFSKFAEKQLKRLPHEIVRALTAWMKDVLALGIAEVRKRPGLHDEPLRGTRSGQRSIRLNRSYRAIYEEVNEGQITLICVMEVNKHEY